MIVLKMYKRLKRSSLLSTVKNRTVVHVIVFEIQASAKFMLWFTNFVSGDKIYRDV